MNKLNLHVKNFIYELKTGFLCYAKSISFVFKYNLWWLFFIPLFLNAIFFFSGFYFVGKLVEISVDFLKDYFVIDNPDLWWNKLIISSLFIFVWVILKILFFLIFTFIGGYIILMIMSPLLLYISEKTDEKLRKEKYPFDIKQFIKDTIRGLLIAIRNLFMEMILSLIIFLIGFLPFIGFVSPLILFVISSYFYGFSFIDYTNERRKLSIKKSVKYIRSHKGLVIANGSIFTLFLLIPFCGVTLATFVAILSVIAATISVFEVENNKKND